MSDEKYLRRKMTPEEKITFEKKARKIGEAMLENLNRNIKALKNKDEKKD